MVSYGRPYPLLSPPKTTPSKVSVKRFDEWSSHTRECVGNTAHHMKLLIATIILGWVAAVTFFGPELARAVNAPEAPKAKVHRRAR